MFLYSKQGHQALTRLKRCASMSLPEQLVQPARDAVSTGDTSQKPPGQAAVYLRQDISTCATR